MNAEQYRAYLLSPAWKDRAKKCLERNDYRCAVCDCDWKRREIHVHHLHYRNVGQEKQEDLVALCKTHHGEIHKLSIGFDCEGLRLLKDNFALEGFEKDLAHCSQCYSTIHIKEGRDSCCSYCGGRPNTYTEVVIDTGVQKLSDIISKMLTR